MNESLILRPEVVEEREKSEYNAQQAERRRIALAILPHTARALRAEPADVKIALDYADLLIAATEYKK